MSLLTSDTGVSSYLDLTHIPFPGDHMYTNPLSISKEQRDYPIRILQTLELNLRNIHKTGVGETSIKHQVLGILSDLDNRDLQQIASLEIRGSQFLRIMKEVQEKARLILGDRSR